MPHSKSYIVEHYVTGTKHGRPFIKKRFDLDLEAVIKRICLQQRVELVAFGAFDDHIHLLVRLRRDLSSAGFMQVVKSITSKWMKQHEPEIKWQTGYASFSVSLSQLRKTEKYVLNQRIKHERLTFRQEIQRFHVIHGFEEDDNSP